MPNLAAAPDNRSKQSPMPAVVLVNPFLIPLVIVLLLITYVPAVSMWLPELLYR